MENIISIKGKVKFSITIDPSVWIFDDRKVDLNTYFETETEKTDTLEEYTKSISKHWDREIMEGAIYPPTLKTEKKYEKENVLTGSFGIPLEPFLENAELNKDATTMTIETKNGEIEVPLEKAKSMILGFSHNGKPLTEDGPVHVYYGDGTNKSNPIKDVISFEIK